MDIKRQQHIDKMLSGFKFKFVSDLIGSSKTTQEAVYLTCAITHDMTRMLYKAIHKNIDEQSAKAAFKIALDTVLLDYGMSIQIHEFNK